MLTIFFFDLLLKNVHYLNLIILFELYLQNKLEPYNHRTYVNINF